jgi:hypothetical protein
VDLKPDKEKYASPSDFVGVSSSIGTAVKVALNCKKANV